ncbi:MAG: SRPBCC domain-containing protein [Caldilineaceae bacterium]
MSEKTMAADSVVIERTFNAPVDLIWRLWTEAEQFPHWYGPTGFTITVVEMDVRVGGRRLLYMTPPNSSRQIWTTGAYKEIVPTIRLVYTDCPSDEAGNILSLAAMGMGDDTNPMITEVTVLLEAVNGQTKMVMTHAGIPAGSPGASGWEQAFDNMAAHIERVQDA